MGVACICVLQWPGTTALYSGSFLFRRRAYESTGTKACETLCVASVSLCPCSTIRSELMSGDFGECIKLLQVGDISCVCDGVFCVCDGLLWWSNKAERGNYLRPSPSPSPASFPGLPFFHSLVLLSTETEDGVGPNSPPPKIIFVLPSAFDDWSLIRPYV